MAPVTANLALQGRVAWVAGAAGPLGRAVAVALAEAGADLALSVDSGDDAALFAMNSIANELWALDRRQLALTMDATDPESAAQAMQQAVTELGRLDLLVTLPPPAATQAPRAASAPTAVAAAVQRRLTGVLLLCRAAGVAMGERGGIVNIVAPEAAGGAVYAAGEAGVLGLSSASGGLAREWAGRVAVNAIRLSDGAEPAAVARLVVLLAGALPGDGAGAISGQVLELH